MHVMTIQWNAEYSVGDDHIDDHHREIFHLISSLDEAVRSNDRDRIDEMIKYLENYTLSHFQEEEEFMESVKFADIEYHKREHDIFKLRIRDLRTFYTNQAPNTHLIFQIRKYVDRLIDHIMTVDSKIAGHEGKA